MRLLVTVMAPGRKNSFQSKWAWAGEEVGSREGGSTGGGSRGEEHSTSQRTWAQEEVDINNQKFKSKPVF